MELRIPASGRNPLPRPFRGALIVGTLLLAAGSAAPGKEAPAAELRVDRLNRSETCGQCHARIFRAWESSVHATSFTNPIFQGSYKKTSETRGAAAGRLCLSCHAPATLVNGDFEAREPVTREGIGCDFCHSVASIDLERRANPFDIRLDGVKRGPFAYLDSPAHGTEMSSLHRDSPLLCASCHEYANESGALVLATYSEWREGPYPARGVNCQGCHMAIVPGDRVRPDVAATAEQRIVNLHRLVGGSSLSQLKRGIEATVTEVKREAGGAVVRIEVLNSAAGHKVPTGLPSKRIRLILTAMHEGRSIHSDERVYSRTLVDKDGRAPVTEGDIFLTAARVSADTRLAPRERRVEIFRFAAPPGDVVVRARLVYEHRSPTGTRYAEEVIQEIETPLPR